MNLLLDDGIVTQTREVKNYWQVLSMLGGLLGVITAVCTVLAKFFSKSLLESELIEDLFYNSNGAIDKQCLQSDQLFLKRVDTIVKD
jgi:hypothetical protein